MNIFDREREEIKKRLNEITTDNTTVIEGKQGEYDILMRLLEILDNNLKQNGIREYLDKRALADLSPLDPKKEEYFINPMNQRFAEQDAIIAKMRNMVSEASFADVEKTRADDGRLVRPVDLPEYNRLYRMKQIIYGNMKSDDYFEYYKLRAESQFGPMSQEQYIVIMGRKPLDGEKFPKIDGVEDTVEQEMEVSAVTEIEPPVTEDSMEAMDAPITEPDKKQDELYDNGEDSYEDQDPSVGQSELESSKSTHAIENGEIKYFQPTSLAKTGPKDFIRVGDNFEHGTVNDNPFDNTLRNEQSSSDDIKYFQPTGLAKVGPTDFILVKNNYEYGTGHDNPFNDTQDPVPPVDVDDINYTIQPDDNPPKKEESQSEDELDEIVEVEKVTPWKWVKKHKKTILIGLGVTALAVTVVLIINQLIPLVQAAGTLEVAAANAKTEATTADNIFNAANDMLRNGKQWSTATEAERLNLHSANVSLADTLRALTGKTVTYDTIAGVWKIGTQTLYEFATSAAAKAGTLSANAATAAAKVAANAAKIAKFTKFANIGVVLSAGLTGAGLIIPKEKSKEYHDIKKTIDGYKSDIPNMDHEAKTKHAKEINNRIISSNQLDHNERDILLRKLHNAIKRAKKYPDKMKHAGAEQVPHVKTDNIVNNTSDVIDVPFTDITRTI